MAIAVLVLGAAATAQAADTLTGRASMRDATTLSIAGGRVRLEGVAVPETRTCGAAACAQAAAGALAAAIGGGPVTCLKSRKLGHGFFLGRCQAKDGADLGRRLLADGLADLGAGADDADRAAVAQAKAERKGMWGE